MTNPQNSQYLLGISIFSILSALFLLVLPNVSFVYSVKDPASLTFGNESYWTTGRDMPSARNELTTLQLGGKIYVMGGEDIKSGGGQKDTVEVYDIERNRWNVDSAASMPLPLDHAAAGIYDGKIYLVGGFLEKKVPTDKLFIYDPAIDKWHEGKSLPSPIGAGSAVFVEDILYVVGGLNASHVPVNTVYAYNTQTDNWTIKAPMPTARHHLQSVEVDGKLYAIGGRILGNGIKSEDIDETLSNFDRNEVYDPIKDSWTTNQHMLIKRSGFTASVGSDGLIYAFGGEGLKKDLDSVEKYNPRVDEWRTEKSMPTRRFGLDSVSYDDKIYVLGGQMLTNPGVLPLTTNEIFHITKK